MMHMIDLYRILVLKVISFWPLVGAFLKNTLVAKELNEKVQHGVYQCQNGPCYETIAEMRMAKSYGADALGMSTTYEGK